MIEYVRHIAGAKALPKRIEVWTRTYEVLGYYQQVDGKRIARHKDKVVLLERGKDIKDKIITTWPMKIYFGHYKEIYN